MALSWCGRMGSSGMGVVRKDGEWCGRMGSGVEGWGVLPHHSPSFHIPILPHYLFLTVSNPSPLIFTISIMVCLLLTHLHLLPPNPLSLSKILSLHVKSQNFLGVCPPDLLRTIHIAGGHFLYLPWAPSILSAALQCSICFPWATDTVCTLLFSSY